MATVNLLPNAEGTVQEWYVFPAPDPPPPHWSVVDDPVGSPNEDLNYVYTGVIDWIEEFNHATSGVLTGVVITNVRVTARMKGSFHGHTVNIGLKIGLIRYPASTDESLTRSYVNYYKDWANDPSTFPPSPWTKSDIDSLQSSLEALSFGAPGASTRCTQIYITVTYRIPAVAGKGLVSWTP